MYVHGVNRENEEKKRMGPRKIKVESKSSRRNNIGENG